MHVPSLGVGQRLTCRRNGVELISRHSWAGFGTRWFMASFATKLDGAGLEAGPSQAETLGKGQQHVSQNHPTQGQLAEAAMLQWPADSAACMIDIGFNLADPSFNRDTPAVLTRARRAGLAAAVLTGTCVRSTRRCAALCKSMATPLQLFYTSGVHPHNSKDWTAAVEGDIRRLACENACVAIGECGLDYNRNFSDPEAQRRAFIAQIHLARALNKPLFLHCRDAYDDFVSILREHNSGAGAAKVCVHCFTGSEEELDSVLALDVYVGITGWVCDDRPHRGGERLKRLLPKIPINRLMIETDAPYLTPRNIKPARARPRRNEPALLGHVLEVVASSINRDAQVVARQTASNAEEFFGLNLQVAAARGRSGISA